MTTTLPTRVIALIGLAVAALALIVFVVRPLVLNDSDEAAAPATQQAKLTAPASTATKPRPATPAKPKLVLLPGLPAPIAKKLRYDRVVVVSVFARPAQVDRQAALKAKAGAKSAGAGFVSVNLFNEASARAVESLVGDADPPAVLVIRRPGKVVNRFQGAPDAAIVAQAAHNAGAR